MHPVAILLLSYVPQGRVRQRSRLAATAEWRREDDGRIGYPTRCRRPSERQSSEGAHNLEEGVASRCSTAGDVWVLAVISSKRSLPLSMVGPWCLQDYSHEVCFSSALKVPNDARQTHDGWLRFSRQYSAYVHPFSHILPQHTDEQSLVEVRSSSRARFRTGGCHDERCSRTCN